ncbi:MAG: GNAT family N-acetyltransferase [Firmicutes bacterium]|jgi:ribosomal protein S18 acetylase RimI-like enzyme|nr:GNAT family N-acetyltransferase [Bacillota bacterium]MDH7495214.1 GNAT family N-acetyltransferase [Bacillota bacterium]
MATDVRIRNARPDDSPIGAALLRMSFPSERAADAVFGLGDPDRARGALRAFFMRDANRFSYEFALVAEEGDRVVGMLLGYESRRVRRLNLNMAFQAPFVYGLRRALRVAMSSGSLLFAIPRPGPGEFYIERVAVLPAWRGRGIGTQLLEAAEKRAKAAGIGKCSLDVDIDNEAARRLYERLGYNLIRTYVLRGKARRCGIRGLHRMVKTLA